LWNFFSKKSIVFQTKLLIKVLNFGQEGIQIPDFFIGKNIVHLPLVAIPTLIGEIEQDILYWPLKYKAIADDWRLHTGWGAHFQRYQQQGCLASSPDL